MPLSKSYLSRSQEVDLVSSYFIFLFLFYFWFIFLYSIFRTGVKVRVMRSHCHIAGHIRWHGHKSHDVWKDVESSRRIMSLSQIRYSLVVILGLNSVSGVQYKDMMIDRWWKVSTEIIDVVKSEI